MSSNFINKSGQLSFTEMSAVTAALKPILLAFVTSKAVKVLVVDLLKALAGLSENSLDDAAVLMVESHLIKD